MHSPQLNELFSDIIAGRIVKRAKHELTWEGRDVTLEFVEALNANGYTLTTVGKIEIQPGERVPAFYLDNSVAYFGWIFWEKFSQLKLRKLFGSVIRDNYGDWAIQISAKRNSVVYANLNLKTEMDIESPSGF
jgi:ABC-type nitrate/sulfonate/bicarbonate transport system substrate-binding protein